jgi:transcriptional regulator with XRE-family HTH domain
VKRQPTTIGKIFRSFRLRRGLSQAELARVAQVSEAVVRKIEQSVAPGSRRDPSFRTVASIADGLGIPLGPLAARALKQK